jgi:transcriptional regulator
MTSIYLPAQFANTDDSVLGEVMLRYNFATLFSIVGGTPFATHLPVLPVKDDAGWHIDAHVARANPQWHALAENPEALLVFAGPHTYVSPTEYRSERRVPTWNYITVHAAGSVEVLHQAEDKAAILAQLIGHHDKAFLPRWQEFEAPLKDSLFGAIVGLRMKVTSLEGKFKLNQHRLTDDRSELPSEYRAADENRRELAAWMTELGFWPAA